MFVVENLSQCWVKVCFEARNVEQINNHVLWGCNGKYGIGDNTYNSLFSMFQQNLLYLKRHKLPFLIKIGKTSNETWMNVIVFVSLIHHNSHNCSHHSEISKVFGSMRGQLQASTWWGINSSCTSSDREGY